LTGLTYLNLSSNQVRRIGGWREGDYGGCMSTRPVDATKYEAFPK
jgi:hypothetical protein